MADETGGLKDALKAAGDAASLLGEELPEQAKAVEALTEKLRDGSISVEHFSEQIGRVIDKTVVLEDKSGRLTEAIGKLVTAVTATDEAVKAANFSKFSKSVRDVTDTIISAVDGIGSVTKSVTGGDLVAATSGATAKLSNFMMAVGGAAALIQPELGIPLMLAGAALKIFSSSATNAIATVDASAKAQEKMVNALLQGGIAVSGHAADIADSAERATEFGTSLGLTKEQAGGVALKLAEMGIRVGATSGGFTDLAGAENAYGKAIEGVTVLSRGLGIDLDSATSIVGAFSARAGLSGEQITDASGKMVLAQHKAGAEAGLFAKNFIALADSSKQYGTNIDSLLAKTTAFSDELVKGTLSIGNVIALTDVQAQSQENQAALAEHIMETDKELAAKMGLVQGDAMGNIMRLGAHSEMASGALIKWGREIGSSQGSVEAGAAVMNTFFKGFNSYIPDAKTAMDIFTGAVKDPVKVMQDLKNAAPDEAFKNMKANAESVLSGLRPASEQLNKAAAEQSASAAKLLRASGALEAALIPARGGAEASTTLSGGRGDFITPAAKSVISTISNQFGFSAAAGATEHFVGGHPQASSKGGGGISIDVGGVHVGGGDSGNPTAGLAEALAKMSRDILKQVEDQWNQAHLAQ